MKFSLLFSLLFISVSTFAQDNFNGWIVGMGMFKLKNNFSIQSDIQVRSTDQWEHVQLYVIRAGLNYSNAQGVMFTAGYAYTGNRRILGDASEHMPEHRIWEQVMYTHKIAEFIPLTHRLRLEQRFLSNPVLENGRIKVEDYSYSTRGRYFLRGIIPVKGQRDFTKGVFAALQNEVFWNMGNKSPVNGQTFDQNRLYLAGGYRFSKKFDMDIGYMNQYILGRNDTKVRNHILQLVGYIRL